MLAAEKSRSVFSVQHGMSRRVSTADLLLEQLKRRLGLIKYPTLAQNPTISHSFVNIKRIS